MTTSYVTKKLLEEYQSDEQEIKASKVTPEDVLSSYKEFSDSLEDDHKTCSTLTEQLDINSPELLRQT